MASENEQVADDFSKIYKHEWQEARAALSKEKHEEEVIYLLMRIVRGLNDICTQDLPNHKIKNLSTEDIVKEYIHHGLPKKLHRDQITNPLRSYINTCTKCLYAMTTLNDPLEIFWIPKGDVIDREKFEIEAAKSGQVCDWTIWPAVVNGSGSVIRKGVVTPI